MTAVAERALFGIAETMALLSMSRTVVYEQIRAGRLQTVHQGRRCYVTASAIERYVALLESEAEADGHTA
jgi:predicted DNA-binding transcriptional regulator AlpA